MIKIKPARNESRLSDKKRNRLLLIVGNRSWHLTQMEAKQLASDILRLTLIPRTMLLPFGG